MDGQLTVILGAVAAIAALVVYLLNKYITKSK